jgi:hypothetical protein
VAKPAKKRIVKKRRNVARTAPKKTRRPSAKAQAVRKAKKPAHKARLAKPVTPVAEPIKRPVRKAERVAARAERAAAKAQRIATKAERVATKAERVATKAERVATKAERTEKLVAAIPKKPEAAAPKALKKAVARAEERLKGAIVESKRRGPALDKAPTADRPRDDVEAKRSAALPKKLLSRDVRRPAAAPDLPAAKQPSSKSTKPGAEAKRSGPPASKSGSPPSSAGGKSQPPASAPGQADARPPLARPPSPPAPLEPPKPSLETRAEQVSMRLEDQAQQIRRDYEERLYMSWIHHDSALEGVVYSFQELQLAIDPAITVVPDSSIQPICDEIRRHKAAIDYIREIASPRKRAPVTTDVVKKIYLLLHPEEGDLKTVKYRKDIPQHRLYFHEYAAPDKIAYAVRQVVEWINDPETRRTRTPVRIAARAHYDLLRAFPFPQDSGKVARLLMNYLLLREGYPPAIIHSAERQRYYEALKGSPLAIVHMVQEALENSIKSIEKYLDERTTRVRSFIS